MVIPEASWGHGIMGSWGRGVSPSKLGVIYAVHCCEAWVEPKSMVGYGVIAVTRLTF